MTEITNVKVYDLEESIVACRNAMRIERPIYTEDEFNASLKRARSLCLSATNSGHCNFLSGIRVSFDLKYPQYLSPELQRYHWIDIVTSASKMHKLSAHIDESSFNKYVNPDSLRNVHNLQVKYNDDPSYENWMMLLSNCPLGLELFMRISTNYLQLRTIYNQRKNHKLKEDWGAMCEFIETLPYFEDFICPIP
jgi:hypothetical protein